MVNPVRRASSPTFRASNRMAIPPADLASNLVETEPAAQGNPCRDRDVQRLHLGVRRNLDPQSRGIEESLGAALLFAAKDEGEALGQPRYFVDQRVSLWRGHENLQIPQLAEPEQFFGGRGHHGQGEDKT